jgi:chromatin segregation and condensation protein Rec8/ScpA/Scc1 (kleisin family)
MLLPRDPEKDEDPRKILIDAIIEYQKAKLAATELSDLYMEYGSRMVKETDDISPDRTYVADHSIELLRAALIHVFTETRLNEKTAQKEFDKIVNAPRIPVHTVISNLMTELKKSDVYLDGFLRNSENKSEIIAKFIGILELLKSHIISIDDGAADDETGVTNMISHAKIALIAAEGEIEAAELDSYQ